MAADCGACHATADLEKRFFAPRESGTIEVTFQVGNRSGKVQKQVHITTLADGEEVGSATTLTLNLVIPQVLAVEHAIMVWPLAAIGREPQSCTVHVAADGPMTIAGLRSGSLFFSATATTVHAGTDFAVVVQPKDAAFAGQCHSDIYLDLVNASGRKRTVWVPASVEAPLAGGRAAPPR